MGYGMLSFQPAAQIGNPRRWREDYTEMTIDAVWREIERGAGTRLPWRHLQMGDERCNRSAYGVLCGRRWTPLLDDRDATGSGGARPVHEHLRRDGLRPSARAGARRVRARDRKPPRGRPERRSAGRCAWSGGSGRPGCARAARGG